MSPLYPFVLGTQSDTIYHQHSSSSFPNFSLVSHHLLHLHHFTQQALSPIFLRLFWILSLAQGWQLQVLIPETTDFVVS